MHLSGSPCRWSPKELAAQRLTYKLEQDRVHIPSPRVLAGLARTLGSAYDLLMMTAGYDGPPEGEQSSHHDVFSIQQCAIVELLERLVSEVAELKTDVATQIE